MEILAENPLILIALGGALAALLLLARGRPPRQIGMGDAERGGGAVSRVRGGTKQAAPRKDHGRHGPDWRTDRPEAASAKPAHNAAVAERRRKGGGADQGEALKIIAGSKDAARAAPKFLRIARLAILAWLALWGIAPVMAVIDMIDAGPDAEALIALPFVAIPLMLGLFGLRFVRRLERRLSAQEGG